MAVTLNASGVTLNSPTHTLNGASLGGAPSDDLIAMTSAPRHMGDGLPVMRSERTMS